MDSEENSYITTNQTYKIWKKNVPFMYSILQTYELTTCSQTIDWFPNSTLANDWKIANLLIGTNSIATNALQIFNVGIPTNDSLTDYSYYREDKSESIIGTNGFIGTLGQQQLSIKTDIPQKSEVLRARVNKLESNYVAVKTGGGNYELIVYDLRNEENISSQGKILEGHSEQGFGLAWSPHESNKLLSGSYDQKILVYNLEAGNKPENSWEDTDYVQDVKWSNFNSNIFASSHHDQKIQIWDTRSFDSKPVSIRKAHQGQVYSIDFNHKSEFLLLSGGQDGDVNLWDTRSMNKKLHTFGGHSEAVNVVSWNPNSTLQFATGSSDRRIIVWNLQKLNDNTTQKTGNEIKFIHGGHRSKITDLAWSKQHQNIIGSCEQNNISQIWKMSDSLVSKA